MLRLVLGKRSVQIHGVFGLDRLVPHTPESFGFWVGAPNRESQLLSLLCSKGSITFLLALEGILGTACQAAGS